MNENFSLTFWRHYCASGYLEQAGCRWCWRNNDKFQWLKKTKIHFSFVLLVHRGSVSGSAPPSFHFKPDRWNSCRLEHHWFLWQEEADLRLGGSHTSSQILLSWTTLLIWSYPTTGGRAGSKILLCIHEAESWEYLVNRLMTIPAGQVLKDVGIRWILVGWDCVGKVEEGCRWRGDLKRWRMGDGKQWERQEAEMCEALWGRNN